MDKLLMAALLAGLGMVPAAQAAEPASCVGEVTVLASDAGANECLRFQAYGAEQAETLLVWLHGDVSAGGPAVYHRAMAERAIADHPDQSLTSVALVRPGYPDDSGQSSYGNLNGRWDHYTAKNMRRVGVAVRNLKARYGANRVFLIGHSGGAATAANVLGLYPGEVDGVLLAACPCDVPTWRAMRGSPWPNSMSPLDQVDTVSKDAKVLAITAFADDNTAPALAENYVQTLRQKGVTQAEFRLLDNPDYNSHSGVFRAPELRTALADLITPKTEGGGPGTEEEGSTGGEGTGNPGGNESGTENTEGQEASSGGGGGAVALLLLPLAWFGQRRYRMKRA